MEKQNITRNNTKRKKAYMKPAIQIVEIDSDELCTVLAVSGESSFEDAEGKGQIEFEDIDFTNYEVWGEYKQEEEKE